MTDMAKSCGECGLCCKLLGVKAIDKPQHSWCPHFKRAQGCRIYPERPQACADFVCYWLRAPNLDEAWRPDRSGFVLHVSEQGTTLNIEVDPARAGAWRREPYYSQLKAWAGEGASLALDLLIWTGRRCVRLTAAGETDLGVRRPASKAA
ncbi:MAG: YkgJ family cysteine cluster protein [Phenylobacterium sp.]